MWQTTIQADLRCVCARCVLCAVFVVRKCIRFVEHIEKRLRDVVHFASTIAAVNVRIVQPLHLTPKVWDGGAFYCWRALTTYTKHLLCRLQ